MSTLIDLFRFIAMKGKQQKQKKGKERKHEFTDSLQKNPHSTTDYRAGADRRRV
jgi:hypothetical protein